MISSFYYFFETIMYAVFSLFPYIFLAICPFYDSLRFSKPVTTLFVSLLMVFQTACTFIASILPDSQKGIFNMFSTAIYFLFYFITIKAHFGKILFTLLMLSNISNLIIVVSKCLEGMVVPQLAVQTYRWSFSVAMFITQLFLLIPVYFYIRNVFTNAVKRTQSSSIWLYLWAVPATFYFIGVYHLYCSGQSALEIALQPVHALFLLIINIGAFLIYHMVVCLINEYDKTSFLESQNHQLQLQKLQYENLTSKISEVQRTKHNMRHHITTMTAYLHNGKIKELEEYLYNYQQAFPDDSPIVYCKNYEINLLLLYFAQQARNNNIIFSVYANIPAKLDIAGIDISVLLGNLLENAIEACNLQPENNRQVIVRGQVKNNSLFLTIDNTFNGKIKQDINGVYISTKHRGAGLGIESARQITMRYNGVFQVTQKEGMFCVSVLLCLK
ncbi:MAG: sensor histidine kinase [Lachnospiraceae bacterium]|nr:sensor histidine kinase [Lachnospiraceae bacterium]